MHLINGINVLEAWQQGLAHVISNNKEQFNLFLCVTNPTFYEKDWLTQYNPKRILKTASGIADVINTIFPIKLYNTTDTREQFYIKYIQRHLRGGRIGGAKHDRWGTYFLRLICYERTIKIKQTIGRRSSTEIISEKLDILGANNQLERVILALSTWGTNARSSLYCHISSPDMDALKPLGNPCLQYIEFTQPLPNTIDLVAVYRSHDYFNKALGNLIGLGQLLQFVCSASGKTAGKLVCHSIRGYVDVSKANANSLLGT